MNVSLPPIPKPKLRGVFHLVAFFISLVTGPILVLIANTARIGAAIFSIGMSALFGVSALYHKPNWRPAVRKWLRKLDHSMIFVLIASTFTPFALVIGTGWANLVLIVVWLSVLLGTLVSLLPISAPKPVVVIPYLALGWLGVTVLPEGFPMLGVGPMLLLAIGGALYTFGAVAYARRSPNPKPETFGYHEIFHVAVVLAAYAHYAAIAIAVV